MRAGLAQAGLPVGIVNTVISIQASFAAGAFDIVTGDVERLGRRPPKPLRDVLAGCEISFGLKTCTAGASKAYAEFLHLWKDADPEIPIYREARTEDAKLP
jgi:hypothetical protein